MEKETTHIGKGGRVVIPVAFRRALGLDVGDRVVAVLEGGYELAALGRSVVQHVRELMCIG